MAKGDFLSSHQRRIVNRYYQHKDTLMLDKLGQVVSDLYLADDAKQAQRLWKTAHTALLNTSANAARVERIVAQRDIKALAALVAELQ